jgi:hypothetical protein
MSTYTITGFAVSAILLFALGFFLLRRQPAVRRMYYVMVLVGLGYLTAVGAIDDIGRRILGDTPIVVPETTTSTTPTTTTPSVDTAPAPEPETAPAPASPTPPANDNPPPGQPATGTGP